MSLECVNRFLVAHGRSNPDRQVACGAHAVVLVVVDSFLLIGGEVIEDLLINPDRLGEVGIE